MPRRPGPSGPTSAGKSRYMRVNAMLLFKMIKAMMIAPRSYDELVDLTGLHRRTIAKWIAEGKRQGLVYIAAWDCRGGNAKRPEFAWGDKHDVPMPKMSVAERNKVYRRNYRAKQAQLTVMHALAGTAMGAAA
jgi:hypothetical protein